MLVSCLLVHARALDGFFLADDYTIIGSFWGKGARHLVGLLAADEIGGAWAERFVRPIRPWSLALDARLWRLDPRGFHLTNLLLHGGASVLVGILVLQLGGRVLGAVLASLLFLLHPVNVEVATWVSGRDESLACAGLLGAVACHLAAGRGRRRLWLGLGSVLFSVSLFAKEYALLLPVAFWALAVVSPPSGISRAHALRDSLSSTVPFFGIIAAFLMLRLHVSGHILGGYGAGAHATFSSGLLVDSVASFARDLFAPLSAHPYAAVTLVLGLLVALATTSRSNAESRPRLIVFWALLWPSLFLMPTHNLAYTPRHLYISFAGIAAAFGLMLARAGEKRLTTLPALAIGGALVGLLVPPTLAAVDDFTRMSNRCRTALSFIELAARSMPRGDVLVLVGMPAHRTPPWGFGWSLEDALRPPFVLDAVDSRLNVIYRRQWRSEAWSAYRRRYPGRGVHAIAWNPAFLGIETLRDDGSNRLADALR